MMVGELFKQRRQERHITIREACAGICSPSTLSRFENGHSSMAAVDWVALLHRLQLDWQDFLPPATGPGIAPNAFISAFRHAQQVKSATAFAQLGQQVARNPDWQPRSQQAAQWIVQLTIMHQFPAWLAKDARLIDACFNYLLDTQLHGQIDDILAAALVRLATPAQVDTVAHTGLKHPTTSAPHWPLTDLRTALALVYLEQEKPEHAEQVLAVMPAPLLGDAGSGITRHILLAIARGQQGDSTAAAIVQTDLQLIVAIQANGLADRLLQESAVQNWVNRDDLVQVEALDEVEQATALFDN